MLMVMRFRLGSSAGCDRPDHHLREVRAGALAVP